MGRKKKEAKQTYINFKPSEVSEAVWLAVIEAWSNGLSDREAAFRVAKLTGEAVTASTIKGWKTADKRVWELCEMLKDDLKATAKINTAKLLREGDDKTTRWYLEHKCPEEFSTKSAVQFEGAIVELSLEEKEKALKEMVEKYRNEQ